jgi:hypothetical protein
VERALQQPGEGIVGACLHREVETILRNVETLEVVRVDVTVDGERQRAVRLGVERARGVVEGEAGIAGEVGGPALAGAQHREHGEPGMRRGAARRPCGERLEKFARKLELR